MICPGVGKGAQVIGQSPGSHLLRIEDGRYRRGSGSSPPQRPVDFQLLRGPRLLVRENRQTRLPRIEVLPLLQYRSEVLGGASQIDRGINSNLKARS